MSFQSEYLMMLLKKGIFNFTNNEMMYYLDKELEKSSKSMNGDLITLLLDNIENNKKEKPQYYFIETSTKSSLVKNKYIFFDKTTYFDIYERKLEPGDFFDCCNSMEKSGVDVIIEGRILKICKFHLFFLLDFFNEMLEKINENQSAVIYLYGIEFVAETGCLIFIRRTIYDYLYHLFKKHNDDELFENSKISDNQKKVISIFKYDENEEKKYDKNANKYSQGEMQCYLNRKRILKRLQNCVTYTKKLNIPFEYVIQRPIYSLKVFYSVKNIECMSNIHNCSKEAVIVLSSYRNDTFTFSFCENCLYDLFLVLEQAYYDKDIKTIKQNNYAISYKNTNDYCFFTGVKEEKMYEIHLVNVYFVIGRQSLEMFFETIVSSSAFAEIYPKIYKQYIPLISRIKQQKQYEKIQKIFEHKLEQKEKVIDKLYDIVKERKVETNLNNSYQSTDKEEKSDERSSDSITQIESKVLNCIQQTNIINLGVSVNKAKKNKIQKLNIIIVNGMKCCTFNHYSRSELVAIIATNRKNDKFCFAMCLDCIKIAINGLEQYTNRKSNYYSNDYDFSIIQVHLVNNEHCYFCGADNKLVRIMFGKVQFELCDSCIQILKNQLEKAYNKLDTLRKLGGNKFFQNEFINLNDM